MKIKSPFDREKSLIFAEKSYDQLNNFILISARLTMIILNRVFINANPIDSKIKHLDFGEGSE